MLRFFFVGKVCNLLSIDSVARFSIGSRAVYSPDDKTYINLNVTDSPKGIYSLAIIPEVTSSGTQQKYSLVVDSEFDRRLWKNDIDSEIESIDTRIDTIDVPMNTPINVPVTVGKYKKKTQYYLHKYLR